MQSLENHVAEIVDVYDHLVEFLDDLYFEYQPYFMSKTTTSSLARRTSVLKAIYPTGETVAKALSRMLINDCVPLSRHSQLGRPSLREYRKAAAWLEGVKIPYNSSLVEKLIGSRMMRFESGDRGLIGDFVRSLLHGTVFLITKLGYFGMTAGEGCEEGDEVWILAGSKFPVILRREHNQCNDRTGGSARSSTPTGARYLIRSEAYVQVLMDGEAVKGASPVVSDDRADPLAEQRKEVCQGRRVWPVPQLVDIVPT